MPEALKEADKDGSQRSKRSALSLAVGYIEYATTPEASEKLNETAYTTCVSRRRSYGGSQEDAGHLPSSALIARHQLMSVSS